MPPPEPSHTLVDRLRREAERRGFTLFGVAPATDADGFGRFCDWLDRGYAGQMAYLHKHREHRRHPRAVVESVRSVVMLGMEYGGRDLTPLPDLLARRASEGQTSETTGVVATHRPHPLAPSPLRRGGVQRGIALDHRRELCEGAPATDPNSPIRTQIEHPLSGAERGPGGEVSGRIAHYARGPDYHRFVWDRLNELSALLMAEVPGSFAHGTCDSAPLLERDFARRAGLGWFGKNTMLINKQRGSFFFLAGLLTSVELPVSEPHTGSHCGTCTACLDACPTQAFPEPGVLDATKCISYLTIELRGPIPEGLREPVGAWLFGCDVCQDVCPWNREKSHSPRLVSPTRERGMGEGLGVRGPGFPANSELAQLDPIELLGLSKGDFERRFANTSLLRARRTGLLRNAAIVLGNIGDERALPALERATTEADEVIADAAVWAAARIRERAGL